MIFFLLCIVKKKVNDIITKKDIGEKYMYRLVAIDLDGTLLNSSGEVSIKTKEAIKKAIDKGIQVVLASRKNNRINRKFCFGAWCR